MIGYLEGRLIESQQNFCLLLTQGGVGYEITLTAPSFAQLPAKGEKIAFYTSLVIREDAQELYGFDTLEEKQTFELLIGISRVGARTAMGILSTYSPHDLQDIVFEGNVAALAKISGIGQKTAQHIFLELKYRLASLKKQVGVAPQKRVDVRSSVSGDTLAAMINLGYAEDECVPIIRKILEEEPDLDVGSAIRQTLKSLAKGNS